MILKLEWKWLGRNLFRRWLFCFIFLFFPTVHSSRLVQSQVFGQSSLTIDQAGLLPVRLGEDGIISIWQVVVSFFYQTALGRSNNAAGVLPKKTQNTKNVGLMSCTLQPAAMCPVIPSGHKNSYKKVFQVRLQVIPTLDKKMDEWMDGVSSSVVMLEYNFWRPLIKNIIFNGF